MPRSVHACYTVLLGCLALVCVCRYVCFAFDLACYTFLLERFAFGSRPPYAFIGMFCVRFTPAVRSCWNVLRLFTPVSFPLSGKERRLAGCCISIPRGSGSPLVRSRMSCGYRALLGSLWDGAFLCGDPDGGRRDAGYEERSRRRGASTFLRKPIGFAVFSAGSPLGAARPQTCAKESSTLWTLFI